MRFISSDSIHIGDGSVLKQAVLAIDGENVIREIIPSAGRLDIPEEKVELFEGILCPGFVNAHCHLELSHMKDKIPTGIGLHNFIGKVAEFRDVDCKTELQAMRIADAEMYKGGISLVGDISNTTVSSKTKRDSSIEYHTFVEVFGLSASKAELVLKRAKAIQSEFNLSGNTASVSAHAPYSLSDDLRKMIGGINEESMLPTTMHNQETESEDELFLTGTGKLADSFSEMGLNMSDVSVTGESSIRSVLRDIKGAGPFILVHNSFTRREDIEWAISEFEDIYWCCCPRANLYIEQQTPNVSEWLRAGAKVCLGTDSLASNHGLSILDELQVIRKLHPKISIAELIKMATHNGACALGMEEKFGRLRAGTTPGLVLLKGLGDKMGCRNSEVSVERII